MALQKQGYNINFAQGLDLKTDPNQVPVGKFLVLQNAVFQNGGGLQKRNGFGDVTTAPTTALTSLTTLNDSLVATGESLYAFSSTNDVWTNQGSIHPISLQSTTLVSNGKSQTSVDTAIAPSGMICTVYMEGGSAYYHISDSSTGQQIIARTSLGTTATNPKVVLLLQKFIIMYMETVTGTPTLRYIAVPISQPTSPTSAVTISSNVKSITTGWDAIVNNNQVYVAWYGSDVGGAIRVTRISATLVVGTPKIIASKKGDLVSVAANPTNNNIWVSYWDDATNNSYSTLFDANLTTVLSATQVINNIQIYQLSSIVISNVLQVYFQVTNTYSFSGTATDILKYQTITSTGTVSSVATILRGVGLASKPIINNDEVRMLVAYGQAYQPTYFLINASGNVIAKLAYQNGGGYISTVVLPSINEIDTDLYVPYLFKDLLVSVNKTQGVPNVAGIYSQTGIKLAKFGTSSVQQYSSDIAASLHLSGGILWQYDSVKPVEHGFHVYPEDIGISTSAAGGNLSDQQYYYQFCYEWTDSQGNLHRSAPSVPVGQVTAGGGTSTNTINVPTLRLTYKTGQNPVRIVGYRWSTAQPVYYQFTSITSPTLNDTTVDSVAITDTLADSSILGNTILYTTGGVVENIAAPAIKHQALFKSRMIVIDAENPNSWWYSKQVIQSTPVEFSDLFSLYIAPTEGAQGSTGALNAVVGMDDKLIFFKNDAIYYVTGTGPDNTGANNDFSQPVYITGTVGCNNPNSIILMPLGIMFQSDKGIWLLQRNLGTKYIGAAVEDFNDSTVVSAVSVPGTNQVRFNLDSGEVLMYDYYYDQWGTFNNVSAISSTLWQGKHTYVNSLGQVRQETPGLYLDGTNPVLLSFSTAWINLQALQGYQRAYYFTFLAQYLSPHKLALSIAYDYDSAQSQQLIITPDNVNTKYGSDGLWGGSSPWGGTSAMEQWRVFLNRQKCQSLQINLTEIYDPSKDVPAGAGFTMSGVNILIGQKGTTPKIAAKNSAG